jgi:hypothetical protein
MTARGTINNLLLLLSFHAIEKSTRRKEKKKKKELSRKEIEREEIKIIHYSDNQSRILDYKKKNLS